MDLGLKDRRVLVTGGSQSIGYAVARGLSRRGLPRGDRRARRRRGCARRWRELGERGRSPARPSTSPSAARRRRSPTSSRTPTFLVNNAGAIPTGDIFSIDETALARALDLKVFGYINLMRAMYRHMRGRGPKVIVNVLGLGGERPQWQYLSRQRRQRRADGRPPSRWAGAASTTASAWSGVNPGGVETERMTTSSARAPQREFGDPERWRDTSGQAARPRRRRQEIADVVVFLASDRAGWVSGAVVPVDGGFLHRENWFWGSSSAPLTFPVRLLRLGAQSRCVFRSQRGARPLSYVAQRIGRTADGGPDRTGRGRRLDRARRGRGREAHQGARSARREAAGHDADLLSRLGGAAHHRREASRRSREHPGGEVGIRAAATRRPALGRRRLRPHRSRGGEIRRSPSRSRCATSRSRRRSGRSTTSRRTGTA